MGSTRNTWKLTENSPQFCNLIRDPQTVQIFAPSQPIKNIEYLVQVFWELRERKNGWLGAPKDLVGKHRSKQQLMLNTENLWEHNHLEN